MAFFAFFAAVMGVSLVLKDEVTHASVSEIGAALQHGPEYDAASARHTRLGAAKLPDWTGNGWRLIGGRADLLDDNRESITGFYQRAGDTIAYTVVDGTGELIDDAFNRDLTVIRTAGKQTVVLTGWPLTAELTAEMKDLPPAAS